MDIELSNYNQNEFMPSRIPKLDALETFIPAGKENEKSFKKTLSNPSRWLPVNGGHKVLIPYDGEKFDSKIFSIAKEAWDHEHCMNCNVR